MLTLTRLDGSLHRIDLRTIESMDNNGPDGVTITFLNRRTESYKDLYGSIIGPLLTLE
ncbi:hypothetical protein [Spirosoma sp. 48-14]|uniref:hypothetical protein n=1 Tax=Spirosoma sp. 48-14 TaxID=1895854 RepID=UPI000ADC04C9|nr:hypothetical protein [Spirosoma sp. 48-14]